MFFLFGIETSIYLYESVNNLSVGSRIPVYVFKMLVSCTECPKVYRSQHGLTGHVERVHEGIIYRCEKCYYYSGRKEALHAHIKAKHEGISYTCEECKQIFKYKPDLYSHKRFKHEGKGFECN